MTGKSLYIISEINTAMKLLKHNNNNGKVLVGVLEELHKELKKELHDEWSERAIHAIYNTSTDNDEETRVLMREIYPLIIKKEDIDFLGKELPDE